MKNDENAETLLTQALHSVKIRKTAIGLVLAGMVICVILLLPPIQKGLALFITPHILSLPFAGLVILTFALCCLFSEKIATFLENSRLAATLGITLLILALGFISVFSYQYGAQWLDSDHASEMVLGKLLAQENKLVSSNWFYSTEIRLVYQTIFTMPLFKLLGRYENWALIRSLNIILNNLVLLLSYLFLGKQLKLQTKWILISGFFLLMPLSIDYWDYFTFGGYYVFFVAQLFICLGLFIALACHVGAAKKMQVYFILFSVSSFVLGVHGIRSLFAFYVPLLIACIYLQSGTSPLPGLGAGSLRPKKKFPVFLGIYGFFLCCAGFAVNSLLHFKYHFVSYGEVIRIDNIFSNFFSKLSRSLGFLTGFFGFSVDSPFFSAQGIFSIAAFTGTIVLIWAAFKLFQAAGHGDDTSLFGGQLFIPVFFSISVLFNIFIFIITSQAITERFFIPFMILYVPLTALLFMHAENTYAHLKRAAVICGIALFIIGQGCLNFQSLAARDINTHRKGHIQYLLDNNLDYGFATFWNANVVTELSNGRIAMTGLDPRISSGVGIHQFRIVDSLNPVTSFDPFYFSGESFLLLDRSEWDLVRRGTAFEDKGPDYEDDNFVIVRFPSAETLYREFLYW